MATYNDLISLVRNWSNRDEEVLSDTIIASALRYAADKAYRTLRVPPLERTVVIDASTLTSSNDYTEIDIPEDLIEFIAIRATDADGKTVRVLNEKTDVRTFMDQYAEKYNGRGYWTRKGNKILVSPAIEEDYVEIYYYRRLFALDSRFEVSAVNANISESYILEVNGTTPINNGTGEEVETSDLKKVVYTVASTGAVANTVYYETNILDSAIPTAPLGQIRTITTNTYYGAEVYNWLKDENERVLLNGALSQLFIYLNEPDTAKLYMDLFTMEIQELNSEEKKRATSGGNVQMNVSAYGMI